MQGQSIPIIMILLNSLEKLVFFSSNFGKKLNRKWTHSSLTFSFPKVMYFQGRNWIRRVLETFWKWSVHVYMLHVYICLIFYSQLGLYLFSSCYSNDVFIHRLVTQPSICWVLFKVSSDQHLYFELWGNNIFKFRIIYTLGSSKYWETMYVPLFNTTE